MIHHQGGVVADTDRRYWRRRANRHVRKARRTRSILQWSGAIVLNLVLLAVVVFSGDRAVRHMTTSPEFSFRFVHVVGQVRCDAESIRRRLADLAGKNLLELDLRMIATRVRDEPWVQDCSVKRILPHAIRIIIIERDPCALALVDGSVRVVDRTGFIVDHAGQVSSENLPLFTGLDGLYGPARDAALRRGVQALERLRTTAGVWVDTVSEIDLSRPDRLGVLASTPGPRLLLDPEQVERNLLDYLALKDEIDDRVGPSEYVDLRWRNRIAVMPEAEL